MASSSVDIEIKIKQVGMQILDQIQARLFSIEKTLTKPVALDSVVKELKAMRSEIQENASAARDFGEVTSKFEDTMLRSSQRTTAVIAGLGLVSKISYDSLITSMLEYRSFSEQLAIDLKSYIFDFDFAGAVQKYYIAPFREFFAVFKENSDSFDKLVTIEPIRQLEDSLGNVNNQMGFLQKTWASIYNWTASSLPELIYGFRGLSFVVTTIGRGLLTISLSRMMAGDAVEFFKRLAGGGREALTPVQRLSRIMTTIDYSMTSTTRAFGQFNKALIYVGGAAVGAFSPIMAGFAALTAISSGLSNYLTSLRLRVFSFFGSTRSQLAFTIMTIRETAFEVSKMMLPLTKKSLLGLGSSPLEKLMQSFKKDGIPATRALYDNFQKLPRIVKSVEWYLGEIEKDIRLLDAFIKLFPVEIKKLQDSLLKIEGTIAGMKVLAEKTIISIGTLFQQNSDKIIAFFGILEQSMSRLSAPGRKILDMPVRTGKDPLTQNIIGSREDLIKNLETTIGDSLKQIKMTAGSKKAADSLVQSLLQAVKNNKEISETQITEWLGNIVTGAGLRLGARKVWNHALRKIFIKEDLKTAMIAASPEEASKEFMNRALKQINILPTQFKKSGRKIAVQLAEGIKTGSTTAENAIQELVEQIAKYFPRSPALLGPLVALPIMGFKIVSFLATGIRLALPLVTKAISLVSFAISKIVEDIGTNVSKAIESTKSIRLASAALGSNFIDTSKTQSALRALGSEITDVTFLVRKITDAWGDKEQRKQLEDVGFNFSNIENAADRTREILLQSADILKSQEGSLRGSQDALSKMGLYAQSALVPALKGGRIEIEKIFNSMDTGLFSLNKGMEKFVVEKTKFESLFSTIKESFVSNILVQLTDYYEKANIKILDTANNLWVEISAVGSLIGSVTNKMLTVISNFGTLVLNEPRKAFNLVMRLVQSLTSFILTEFIEFLSLFGGKALGFVTTLNSAVWSVIGSVVIEAAGLVLDEVVARFDIAGKEILDTVKFWIGRITGYRATVTTKDWLMGKLVGEPTRFTGDPAIQAEVEARFQRELAEKEKAKDPKILEKKLRVEETQKRVEKAIENMVKNASEGALEVKNSFVGMFDGEEVEKYTEGLKKRLQELQIEVIDTVGEIGDPELLTSVKALMNALSPENLLAEFAKLKEEIKKIREEAEFTREILRQGFSFDFKTPKNNEEKEEEETFEDYAAAGEDAFGRISGAFGHMYEIMGKKSKEWLIAQKIANIAQAGMNIALGITRAIGMDGILGLIMAPIIAATGAIQLAAIASAPIGYFSGGLVRAGRKDRDSVPAMVAKDEYILSSRATDKYGIGIFDAFNSLSLPEWATDLFKNPTMRFEGGLASGVKSAPIVSVPAMGQEVNIVNVSDPNDFERFLSTKRAETIHINTIQRNATQVRKILGIR